MKAVTPRYRVAIIGAGKVGSGDDTPSSKEFLTHAHAIVKNPTLSLAALVDTDGARAATEASKWDAKSYTDIEAMFAAEKPDVVVIATPDDTHARLLTEVAARNVRLIVLEKPAVTSDAEAARLSQIPIPMPVVVNFRRRFDPTVQTLAEELVRGMYGRVISARGTYMRGILHNGSHMLDLARILFGEMRSAKATSRLDDFPEGLPTIGGIASFERCPEFHLVCGRGGDFVFELEILTEKKRFHFTDEGFTLTTEDIGPAHTLGEPQRAQTGLSEAFPNLYEHVIAVLDGEESVRSTLENALKTHDACMQFAAEVK